MLKTTSEDVTRSPSASPKKCNPDSDIAVHLCAGDGESAEGLHSLFRTAWEAQPGSPVPLFGNGQNIIPTIHAADLAAYVAAVCIEPPAQQYLLAVDDAQLTQRDVVAAVAQKMGGTPVKELGLEELYFQQVMQLLAVHVAGPLPIRLELMILCCEAAVHVTHLSCSFALCRTPHARTHPSTH